MNSVDSCSSEELRAFANFWEYSDKTNRWSMKDDVFWMVVGVSWIRGWLLYRYGLGPLELRISLTSLSLGASHIKKSYLGSP